MYLGKIIVDDVSADSIAQRKARVFKKVISVGLSGSSVENIDLFDQVYPYVLKCYEDDFKKAFKVFEADEEGRPTKTLLIIKDENLSDAYDVEISEEDHDFVLDATFQGEFHREIQDDYTVLLKRYDPSGYGRLYAIGGAIGAAVLIGALVWNMTSVPEPTPEEMAAAMPKEKVITPLSQTEQYELKRLITKEIIATIKNEVLTIAKDPNLKGRAIIQSMSGSYTVEDDRVKYSGNIAFQLKYPITNSVRSSEALYTTTKPFTIQKSRGDFSGEPLVGMSVECVKMAMNLPGTETMVSERTADIIKFGYSKMRPSSFAGPFETLVSQCPMGIDTVAIADGKFEISAILYNGGRL